MIDPMAQLRAQQRRLVAGVRALFAVTLASAFTSGFCIATGSFLGAFIAVLSFFFCVLVLRLGFEQLGQIEEQIIEFDAWLAVKSNLQRRQRAAGECA